VGERCDRSGSQAEHRGLRKHVAGAKAAGMKRVALDFGRPSFVTFDEQAGGDAAKRHGRRIEQRPAGDDLSGCRM
jgi:hypothetical protein